MYILWADYLKNFRVRVGLRAFKKIFFLVLPWDGTNYGHPDNNLRQIVINSSQPEDVFRAMKWLEILLDRFIFSDVQYVCDVFRTFDTHEKLPQNFVPVVSVRVVAL